MKSFNRIGLALKGGCREGAYQAGVVTALAERNIEVDVLTGEGIGGLNAGIISASENIKEASTRLAAVWEELSISLEKDADIPLFLQYTLSAGHQLHYSSTALRILARIAKRCQLNLGIDTGTGTLEDTVLTELLNDYLDEEKLAGGKPFYAMTFKTTSYLYGIGVSLLAATNLFSTPPSNPVLVQSVNRNAIKPFLLSSVSTPLLFKTFRYNEYYNFDGRIGGNKMGIANPLYTTLVRHNCDLIIAPFCTDKLQNDSVSFIPVNPLKPMARSFGLTGAFKDHFGLTPNMVETWMTQGYYDTLAILDVEEAKGVLFAPDENTVKIADEDNLYNKAIQTLQSEIGEEKH